MRRPMRYKASEVVAILILGALLVGVGACLWLSLADTRAVRDGDAARASGSDASVVSPVLAPRPRPPARSEQSTVVGTVLTSLSHRASTGSWLVARPDEVELSRASLISRGLAGDLDDEGRFSVSVEAGDYLFCVEPSGHPRIVRRVSVDGPLAISFEVESDKGAIRGELELSGGGYVAGARIWCFDGGSSGWAPSHDSITLDGRMVASAVTDSQGRFEIHGLELSHDYFVMPHASGALPDSGRPLLWVARAGSELRMTLRPACLLLALALDDATGMPIEDATFAIMGNFPWASESTLSPNTIVWEGERIRVPEVVGRLSRIFYPVGNIGIQGGAPVRVSAPGYEERDLSVPASYLRQGSTPTWVTIRLRRAQAAALLVRASVTDGMGVPVVNASLVLQVRPARGELLLRHLRTDSNGLATVGLLEPGDYAVYPEGQFADSSISILEGMPEPVTWPIRLSGTIIRLSTRGRDGKDVRGVAIRFALGRGPVQTTLNRSVSGLTLSGGFYRRVGEGCLNGEEIIGSFSPGEWTFEVYAPGFKSMRKTIEIGSGGVIRELVFDMSPLLDGAWDDWDRSPLRRASERVVERAPGGDK